MSGGLTTDPGVAPAPVPEATAPVSSDAAALGMNGGPFGPPISLAPPGMPRRVVPQRPAVPAQGAAMPPEVRERVGAAATGGDVYERAVAGLIGPESGGRADAQNPVSSAGGLTQMIDSTWLDLIKKNRPDVAAGKSDVQLLSLKYDPGLNKEMAVVYARNNGDFLASRGIPVNEQTIQAAHRLGVGGAEAVIRTAVQNPAATVGQVLGWAPGSRVAESNRDVANMPVGQFLSNPYPRGGGQGGSVGPQQQYALGEANRILAQMAGDRQKGEARVAELSKGYKPIDIKDPPKPPDVDPLATFGSAIGMFAMVASTFSRTPAVAAMNSMAGAISSAKQAKWDDYKAHYEQWKTNTDLMFKAHDEQAKDIRQAMEVMTHNVAAGTSMLNATLAVSGDEQQRRHLAQGDFVAMQRLEMDRERHVTKMKTAAPLARASQRLATTMQVLEQARQSGDPEQIRIAEENFKSAQTDYNAVKYPHSAAGKQPPQMVRVGTGEAVPALWDSQSKQWLRPGTFEPLPGQDSIVPMGRSAANAPQISPAAARNVAEQVLAGNTAALSGFGRNPAMLAQIENAIAEVAREKGMTGTDVVKAKAEFAAYSKALKDFATGKQGQTAQALNVATAHLAQLAEAAKALAQNDSRTLNLLVNTFRNEFGWEQPITFDAIKTIVGSEVEKAVAGSAGALEDRKELRAGLTAQSTPQQLHSVIESYKGLMAGQLRGLENTYERTTKRDDFRQEFLLPETRVEMDQLAPRQARGQSTAPAAAPSSGRPGIPASLSGKPGLQWNSGLRKWRDGAGKVYNEAGVEEKGG